MGLVRLLQIKGHRHVRRVYGPDLLLQVCAAGLPRGRRHYLYGGDSETLGRLESVLHTRFPGIVIAGSQAPPFRSLSPEEDEQAVQMINLGRPDVVWVALGSPKQERWMSEHRGRVKAPVMIGVGAAFDFLSGGKPQAPRWMQQNGLEWLFRLATEPRRLWRRYARYPLFAALVTAQALGWRQFPGIDEGRPPP
jgi:N-acetylglucosaminyldiphosphoundecaprenol N-acetyl-beta-D-mannosaminyltransferase